MPLLAAVAFLAKASGGVGFAFGVSDFLVQLHDGYRSIPKREDEEGAVVQALKEAVATIDLSRAIRMFKTGTVAGLAGGGLWMFCLGLDGLSVEISEIIVSEVIAGAIWLPALAADEMVIAERVPRCLLGLVLVGGAGFMATSLLSANNLRTIIVGVCAESTAFLLFCFVNKYARFQASKTIDPDVSDLTKKVQKGLVVAGLVAGNILVCSLATVPFLSHNPKVKTFLIAGMMTPALLYTCFIGTESGIESKELTDYVSNIPSSHRQDHGFLRASLPLLGIPYSLVAPTAAPILVKMFLAGVNLLAVCVCIGLYDNEWNVLFVAESRWRKKTDAVEAPQQD